MSKSYDSCIFVHSHRSNSSSIFENMDKRLQYVRSHLHPDAVTKSNQVPFEVTRVQGVHGIAGRYNFARIKFISRGHYFKHSTKDVISYILA